MKRCIICNIEYEDITTNFRKAKKNGYDNSCKICRRDGKKFRKIITGSPQSYKEGSGFTFLHKAISVVTVIDYQIDHITTIGELNI